MYRSTKIQKQDVTKITTTHITLYRDLINQLKKQLNKLM